MFPRVSYHGVRELGRQSTEGGHSVFQLRLRGLGDLGVSLSSPGLSVPVEMLRVPRRVS